MKRLHFSEHLTLDRRVYEGRDTRQYRLAAVVEHIGDKGVPYARLRAQRRRARGSCADTGAFPLLATASTGHYVTFARDVVSGWLRIDDTIVQHVPLHAVLERPPYLLVYEHAVA